MSGGAFRTAAGGRIDRSRPVNFAFNGRRYRGFAGDTLASALLANGVHLVARGFKYHRPRGVMTAGSEEPSALIQLETGARTEPNLRATQVELYEGLRAGSQNAWPSVDVDLGAVNGLLAKIFVAGFYYKTFMHPKSFWMKVYEPLIRRAAGLGRAPREADPDAYDKTHAHCDVLVVGAGPAGLTAALAAARTGARVILADEGAEFGGSLLSSRGPIDGRTAGDWAAGAVAELARSPEATLLRRTTAVGYFDHNYVTLVERRSDHLPRGAAGGLTRQRLWKVRAERVVLATGAHERPLVFADNDRPGIMLADSVRTYVNRYGVLPGRRAVVFANNDSAYGAALDMAAAGIEVAAVVDLRASADGVWPERARAAGLRVMAGSAIVGTRGKGRVRSVEVMRLTGDGEGVEGEPERLACDLVAVSGGWNPSVHLFSQAIGKLRFDDARGCFLPDAATQALASAGACDGVFDLPGCLRQGADAGAEAARLAGFEAPPAASPSAETVPEAPMKPVWLVPGKKPVGHGGAKHFVDFQNDVTAADVGLAVREGYRSVEHLKRYTTTGMGTDQGKTSNVNALALLARQLGAPIPAVGTTTFRPPYTPVTYGVLAGRDVGELADPARVTPMHGRHVERGAVFEDVGQWKRPHHFPRPGETEHAAVRRECRAVRTGVGVLDASTLGKIDVQGPDAALFLNRVYTNAWMKLGVGRCRYGLMCKEDGMVMDDGVTTRLGPNRYLMTTTTGNAAKVLEWLEDYLQTEWTDLRVYLTSVTEHWATASVAGPKAREVIAKIAPDLDLSPEVFPFMAMRDAVVAGVPARVFRISFTGELSYEVNVPAQHGRHVWDAIMAAGEDFGVTPYGTEAMHVLRAEKGFVIVGQETDGTVTPFDLGMEWIVSKQKPDFVGRRSHARPDTARTDRKQMVGLLTDDPGLVLPEGVHLTENAEAGPLPAPMLGHVTSSYFSETLGRSIALALVKDGFARRGGAVHAQLANGPAACRVAKPVFYDPEGARLHG